MISIFSSDLIQPLDKKKELEIRNEQEVRVVAALESSFVWE